MPLLDVSFVTSDPMLCDSFSVTRRSDVVGADGFTTPTPGQVFDDLLGVVTQQEPADLMRAEDGQTMPRRIFVASTFQFLGVSPGTQPDLVSWNGVVYTVEKVLPYSRFGGGTYEAVCAYQGPVAPAQ